MRLRMARREGIQAPRAIDRDYGDLTPVIRRVYHPFGGFSLMVKYGSQKEKKRLGSLASWFGG